MDIHDYANFKVGDSAPFPVIGDWRGVNQTLWWQISDHTRASEGKQFVCDTLRPETGIEFVLRRVR